LSSIKQNFIFNALLSLSQVVFPLITFPYVARVILPTGIGEVTLVESICKYVILFSALGIPIYGVREIAKVKNEKEKLNKLFTELIIIHFTITIFVSSLFVILIYLIPLLYNKLEFYLLGLLLILSNVFVIEWYFQGIGQFKFITIRNLIVKTILTILVFIVVKEKTDVLTYFSLIVITSILNAVVNFVYALRIIKLDFSSNLNNLKKHFKPLFYIFSSIAFISIYTLLDTIMLGFMTDERTVGLYSTGLKVSRIPMLFIGALGVVLIPRLSEHFHHNRLDDFISLINKSVKFVITFSVPTLFLLLSLSDTIIVSFAGSNFIEAGSVLKILSLLSLLIGLSNIFGLQILTPMGQDKYLTFSVLIGMVISLGLNLILIPIYKEKGAAISNIIAEIAVTIATIFFASKFIKLIIDWKFVFKTIIYSIPLFFIPIFVSRYVISNISLMIITIVLSGIYFLPIQLYVIKNELFIDLKNKIFKNYE
jgi:O-antigen/teichoic acid export membrane protein